MQWSLAAYASSLWAAPDPDVSQLDGTSDKHSSRYVDTFLGVSGGGHVFPGASAPFGNVKVGIDTTDVTGSYIGGGNNAGWSDPAHSNATAISYLHVSGTGGGAKYGVIAQTPTAIDVNFDALNSYTSRFSNEQSSPGYYALTLDDWGVDVALAASPSVGTARYDFSSLASRGARAGQVLIDLGHVLGAAQTYREGYVKVHDDLQTVTGYDTYRGGWNYGDDFTVYFCSRFSRPADGVGETQGLQAPSYGTFENVGTHAGWPEAGPTADRIGAFLVFDIEKDPVVVSKLGISFVSTDAACDFVERDTGSAFDFDAIKANATAAWDTQLASIHVEGGVPPNTALRSEDYRQMFYSALYRTQTMPVDRRGESLKWNTTEPVYDDWYTIWDLYRCSTPLLTLIQPRRMRDMLRSLIDIWRHEGWMPDGRAGFSSGLTQGGSNADMLLADAYVKKIDLDWDAAYAAMVADAEDEPPAGLGLKMGRSRLEEYKRNGFVGQQPSSWWDGRSMSKTMEYAANDRALATVARGLDRTEDYRRYMARSRNWRNLYDAEHSFMAEQGWLVPRYPNGTAYPWNLSTSTGNWDKPTYEGTGLEYQFAAPHDVQGMICQFGGAEVFNRRLDAMFATTYDPGNEPSFLSPFLYLWTGEYQKTADRVLAILSEHYATGWNGIPGNDDSGAMGAYFIWLSIGLYPSTGTDLYLIGTPTFAYSRMKLGDSGKFFTIRAKGLSRRNRYVVNATLNGRPLTRAWFRHEDIFAGDKGGELVFEMGSKPSSFGTSEPPPSDTESCEE